VQAVRQRLAEARAQWNAGRRKVAEEQLVALLSESRALRWPPLIAESALQRARSANLAHHRDEAVEAAREAVLAAEESNLPRLAALAWSERAGAEVGMTAAQTAAATESISHAAALLRGAGGDAAEEAAIESVRGRILGSAYRPSEAEASYLKAAELYRKARNDAGAATALTNIGGARENQHKLRGAVEAHEQALVILRRIYDESHPLVHRAKEFLVYPLAKLGRLDEAEQLGKAALAAALANDLPYDAALARDGLSFIPSRRGHPSEGLPLARTALEGFEATLGPDNVTTAERRASLAELLLECGQSREALPLLRQTIETAIKQGAKELHASALGTLSLVLLDLGQRPQALETAREAVSRALESGDAEERVRSQLALGTILRTEDRAAAKAALAAAQAAMSMLDPPDVHVTEQATRLARSLAEEPR
jgi:tetratricopeptide (TPR) repeat protein